MASSDGEEKARLLNLPRELRDEIYQQVFEMEEAELTSFGIKHKSDIHNLCLTSKQVHAETITLYYKHTTFKFHFIWPCLRFLERLSDEYSWLITCIRYDLIHFWNAPERRQHLREFLVNQLEATDTALQPGVLKYRTDDDREGKVKIWESWPPVEKK